MKRRVACLWFGLMVLFSVEAAGQGNFALANTPRVVFLGDSITYADRYIAYLEAAIASRFPNSQIELVNRGMPSETVAGTSEPSHNPPRPNLHERFTSTVPHLRPDLIVACYGMNDGMYQPPNQETFKKFQIGITDLIARIGLETRANLLLMTPPPFDSTPFRNTGGSGAFDYRRPALNYDQALTQFSAWLMSLRQPGMRVVDLHTIMAQHLALRRQTQPTFNYASDGIHPNATGHWVIAQSLLMVWNFPPVVSEARIDGRQGRGLTPNVRNLKVARDGVITFEWISPLPLPIDPEIDLASLALLQSQELLGRQTLTVTGLRTNEYILSVNGQKLMGFGGQQFASGIPFHQIEQWPMHAVSRELLRLVSNRRGLAQGMWVAADPSPRFQDMKPRQVANAAQVQAIGQQIRQLAQPKPIKIELRPIAQRVPGDTNLPPSAVLRPGPPAAAAPTVVPNR